MSAELKGFYRKEARDYHAIRYGSWYGRVFARLHHALMLDVLEQLPAEGRALDVATGTGHSLEVLHSHAKDLFAVDLTMEMLQSCRARLPAEAAVVYLASNALSLPFRDASFDLVNSSRFLHLLPKPLQQQALIEFGRVLKPGGTLIVDFYNRSHWDKFALPIRIYRRLRNKRPTGDTLNTPDEVGSWMAVCGLDLDKIAGVGSYGLAILRPLPMRAAAAIGRCFGKVGWLAWAEQFLVVARKR